MNQQAPGHWKHAAPHPMLNSEVVAYPVAQQREDNIVLVVGGECGVAGDGFFQVQW